ncbi:hypothetical protein FS837_005916, partial [Tulasnella sp. UAMH 9824]
MATIIDDSPYGYIPTRWICVLFVALFSLTSAVHLGQAAYYRMWWLIPTMVLGGIGEIIGWAGRAWSSWNYHSDNAFYMNICCTIIAPSFMTAAMFVIMGRIINLVGAEYSRLKPRTYSILFISADLLALIIQAIGGAAAASADTHDGAEGGAKIMLAGIFVQMAAITVYCIIQGDYLWRVLTERPVRPRPIPSGAVTPRSDIEDSSQNLILGSQPATGRARLTPNIKSMLLGLGIAT